jgi:hypothetical protein
MELADDCSQVCAANGNPSETERRLGGLARVVEQQSRPWIQPVLGLPLSLATEKEAETFHR